MTAMSLFLKAEKQSLLVFLVLPINKEILVKFCHKENGVNSAANVEIGDSLQEINFGGIQLKTNWQWVE